MACIRQAERQVGCCRQGHPDGTPARTRRGILQSGSALALGLSAGLRSVAAHAEPGEERPKPGDLLIMAGIDHPVPLAPNDIAEGASQVFAWPFDAGGKIVRSASRFNKLLLLRFDPATLAGATREHAAEGVVAYSAICPHAGCEVTAWLAERKILECPCHSSHYDPQEAGAVIDGPSMRPLPALPLTIAAGKLAVAKPFTSRPGIVPA